MKALAQMLLVMALTSSMLPQTGQDIPGRWLATYQHGSVVAFDIDGNLNVTSAQAIKMNPEDMFKEDQIPDASEIAMGALLKSMGRPLDGYATQEEWDRFAYAEAHPRKESHTISPTILELREYVDLGSLKEPGGRFQKGTVIRLDFGHGTCTSTTYFWEGPPITTTATLSKVGSIAPTGTDGSAGNTLAFATAGAATLALLSFLFASDGIEALADASWNSYLSSLIVDAWSNAPQHLGDLLDVADELAGIETGEPPETPIGNALVVVAAGQIIIDSGTDAIADWIDSAGAQAAGSQISSDHTPAIPPDLAQPQDPSSVFSVDVSVTTASQVNPPTTQSNSPVMAPTSEQLSESQNFLGQITGGNLASQSPGLSQSGTASSDFNVGVSDQTPSGLGASDQTDAADAGGGDFTGGDE